MGILNPQNNGNNSNGNTGNNVSLLGDIRNSMAQRVGSNQQNQQAQERKPSEFWLNVGVTLPGAGKDGEDLFISLPNGIALDDMKPTPVRGNNSEWIQLAQAKNAFLEELQQAAASLNPGDRVPLGQLTVELYRKANPAQTGTSQDNPLIARLSEQLKG